MTVAIPEAVGAVESAGSGAVASRSGGRVARGQVTSSRYETPRRRPARARSQRTYTYTPPEGSSRSSGGGFGGQGAILAEFLIAVLVVAFLPLAAGPPEDGKAGPSPYRVNDITQLASIGVVYFLLALLAQGGHGRMAGWFGGLILLGIGFKKLASGQFSGAVSGLQGKPPPVESPYAGGTDNSSGAGGGHDEAA